MIMKTSRRRAVCLFVMSAAGLAASGAKAAPDCEGIAPLFRTGDIGVFVDAILGRAACPFQACNADLDLNGTIDGRDVAAFVDCILSIGDCPTAPNRRLNEIQPFDWAESECGFGFYTSLNTNLGAISGGSCPHSSIVQDGMLCAEATHGACGTSFEGRFISLLGLNTESDRTIDLADPMHEAIRPPFRVGVSAIRVRVKGVGQYRLEVKNGDDEVIHNWPLEAVDSDEFVDRFFEVPASLPHAKLLNLIVESQPVNSSLCFDRLDFIVTVPSNLVNDPLLYGFVSSYGPLLRALGPQGFTKDRNTFPSGDFDSVPATGFQILAAAMAYDLQIVSLSDAQSIAEQSVAALLSIPREPTTGLLPHFLEDGVRHEDSEWSSVDTALACIAAVEGLQSLGMEDRVADVLTQIVGGIDFATFTFPNGEISHGVGPDGQLLAGAWNRWGGELTLVEILRALTDPALPPATADRCVEHDHGTGFIVELAALFIPEFGMPGYGADQYGIDWHARRLAHLENQVAFIGETHGVFGLSAGEVIDAANACTAYLAAGIGTENPPAEPVTTLPGYGPGPWVFPHYISMTAALDPQRAEETIRLMRDGRNLWGAINGPPESIHLGPDGCAAPWHRAQITLNATFHVLGLYHAICSRDGRPDVAYNAVDGIAGLRQATDAVFQGLPIILEGEHATGDGSVMYRSEASGDRTRWLHAGESASWIFDLATCNPTTQHVLGARYSNDNYGPLETVTLTVDGEIVGQFQAQDTGDGGLGWNVFVRADGIATIWLDPGPHTASASVSGGDGYGVEIDLVDVTRP